MTVPAGTYKARLSFQLGSPKVEDAVFGFHLRNADTVSQASTDDIAAHVAAKWVATTDNLKQFMGTSTILRDISVYALDANNRTSFKSSVGFPESGTGLWAGTAAGSLPWECAPVVSLHGYATGAFTAAASRKRGRMYMPPYASGKVTNPDGIMTNGDVDTYHDAVQAFLEAVNDVPAGRTAQARVIILSVGARVPRAPGGPLGALLPALVTDVQDVVMTSTIHSQRRREKSQPVNHSKVGTLDA